MLVFTKEWIDALAEALKEDDVYQKKAEGFDSSYQFVVQPSPKRGVTESRACGLNLPQCDEAWEGIRQGTDYTMTAPYDVFHSVFVGKASAVKVIATRKAKVKGNLAKLLKFTGAINRFVEVMQGLPNEFEGDFVSS